MYASYIPNVGEFQGDPTDRLGGFLRDTEFTRRGGGGEVSRPSKGQTCVIVQKIQRGQTKAGVPFRVFVRV